MNVHSPSRIQSASMARLLSVDAFYQILRSGFIIMQPPGFYKRESKTAVRERRKSDGTVLFRLLPRARCVARCDGRHGRRCCGLRFSGVPPCAGVQNCRGIARVFGRNGGRARGTDGRKVNFLRTSEKIPAKRAKKIDYFASFCYNS